MEPSGNQPFRSFQPRSPGKVRKNRGPWQLPASIQRTYGHITAGLPCCWVPTAAEASHDANESFQRETDDSRMYILIQSHLRYMCSVLVYWSRWNRRPHSYTVNLSIGALSN